MKQITVNGFTLFICENFWERSRGLLGKEHLLSNGAMLILQCNWVHTLFMSKTIEVTFLSSSFERVSGPIVLPPWRFSPMNIHAKHALEMAYPFNSSSSASLTSLLSKLDVE